MVRLTNHLDMTIAVDWDVKPQTKQIRNFIKKSYLILKFPLLLNSSNTHTQIVLVTNKGTMIYSIKMLMLLA